MYPFSRLKDVQIPQVVHGQTLFAYKHSLASFLKELTPDQQRAIHPDFAEVHNRFENSGASYQSPRPGMYINMPIPDGYFRTGSPNVLEGVDECPTLLLTFGPWTGKIHVEEQCCSGVAQLDFGRKIWRFWPPGPRPKPGRTPHLVLHQQKGDLVVVVGG